jgi:two-component system, LytTR family, response regulator LytT
MKAHSYLIVEDEFLIAENIAEILAKAGCSDVRTASTGEEAIDEIENRRPDIVLTDINLGEGKSGIDLGDLLHKKYTIPFIYITSYSDPETVRNAKVTVPNAYLIKPFKNEDLLVAIELALFNSSAKKNETFSSDELLIKDGRVIVRFSCNAITWFETDGNYVTIYLADGNRKLIRITLTELKRQLPEKQFLQIHKSYLINRKFVSEVRANSVKIQNTELPVGRAFQSAVENFFSK